MMLKSYLETLMNAIATSKIIQSSKVVESWVLGSRGYLRVRVTLINGDFLELAESFGLKAGQCVTLGYRYQWMDENKRQLRKRWDDVRHFPDLPNFPHHVHVDAEDNVFPGEQRNVVMILQLIEQELA